MHFCELIIDRLRLFVYSAANLPKITEVTKTSTSYVLQIKLNVL